MSWLSTTSPVMVLTLPAIEAGSKSQPSKPSSRKRKIDDEKLEALLQENQLSSSNAHQTIAWSNW